jgi:hypothetical protein
MKRKAGEELTNAGKTTTPHINTQEPEKEKPTQAVKTTPHTKRKRSQFAIGFCNTPPPRRRGKS